ncbi:MAG TPA: type II secretion system protein [Thermoanaerobaculia bacterium]|nr:type II secretion system protein [Thermoanaerobaculia bacterium]
MNQKGFNLLELIVTLSVMGFVLTVGAPPLLRISGDLRLHLATQELVGVLRVARSYALRHDANVAVKFRTGRNGVITFALYRDGDGDGVLTRDIDAGTDPQVSPPRPLAHLGRGFGFGFPPGPPPRDPSTGRPMDRLDDPIRFNQSDLASFGPLGTSTPGSLYITDSVKRLALVRVANRTGRVRVLTYNARERVWRN